MLCELGWLYRKISEYIKQHREELAFGLVGCLCYFFAVITNSLPSICDRNHRWGKAFVMCSTPSWWNTSA
jgi:hypothetical protein